MKKFVCSVCGYVHEGDAAPERCPQCKVPAEKFVEQKAEMGWAAEHVVGVAQGAPEEIMEGLRANFMGECTEVGMYLAMARVAHREGYPEIGLYWEKAAYEEAEHAAKFAELLGEVVTASTEENLKLRVAAEHGAAGDRQGGQGIHRNRQPEADLSAADPDLGPAIIADIVKVLRFPIVGELNNIVFHGAFPPCLWPYDSKHKVR